MGELQSLPKSMREKKRYVVFEVLCDRDRELGQVVVVAEQRGGVDVVDGALCRVRAGLCHGLGSRAMRRVLARDDILAVPGTAAQWSTWR